MRRLGASTTRLRLRVPASLFDLTALLSWSGSPGDAESADSAPAHGTVVRADRKPTERYAGCCLSQVSLLLRGIRPGEVVLDAQRIAPQPGGGVDELLEVASIVENEGRERDPADHAGE